MNELILFELRENVRSKWMFVFAGFLAISSGALNYFGDENGGRLVVSQMNLILFVVPLFSITFAGLTFNDSLPFAEVLLSKSLTRSQYFFGKYCGVSLSLFLSFLVGLGIPGVPFLFSDLKLAILFVELIFFGTILILVFVSLGFLLASFFKKGELIVSGALLVWLYFFLLFDSFVFMLSIYLGDYPVEIPALLVILFNPVDLVRILIILQTKASVLLGFSGAFLIRSLGTSVVILLSILFLVFWVMMPLTISYKRFLVRNF